MQRSKVNGRSKDNYVNVVVSPFDNPVLNTMVYDVEFPDGAVCKYAANIITENMFAQFDYDGFASFILDGILDYAKIDDAVSMDNRYFTTQSGQRRLRKSKSGWFLLVSLINGSVQWIPLSVLKESNPLDVDEFTVSHKIYKEPDFHWWVPYTLLKIDMIVSAVNARAKRVTHNYGIEVTRTVKEALAFDDPNGNYLWQDSLDK